MPTRNEVLSSALANLARAHRAKRARSGLATDKTLQQLVSDLIAARFRAGLTQNEVAERMWTTKSAVSRLESGRHTRPTLSTKEKYAIAVGCRVEVKLRSPW